MARNGSGTYSLPSGNPVSSGAVISSSTHNTTMTDIATALTASIAKDGQTTPTADLPMGNNKHTGVAAATARTNYASAAQVQDGTLTYLTSVSGTDTITATAPISMTAYAAGQVFQFIAAGANTGAVTLNLNSIGAKSITKHGTTALVAGDIPSGATVTVIYDGTQFQLDNPFHLDIENATAVTTLADDDDLIVYDSSAGSNRSVTFANLAASLASVQSMARIKTGTYTGDGATSQGVTGVGFAPKAVWVWVGTGTDDVDLAIFFTTDEFVDNNASGMAIIHEQGGSANQGHRTGINRIISLDSDGFTVDDSGSDAHPNTNGTSYQYLAIG